MSQLRLQAYIEGFLALQGGALKIEPDTFREWLGSQRDLDEADRRLALDVFYEARFREVREERAEHLLRVLRGRTREAEVEKSNPMTPERAEENA